MGYGVERGLSARRQKGTVWSGQNVLYIDGDGRYAIVYFIKIHQNLQLKLYIS